ncbi:Multidrug resistance protein [Marasmius tenuissimus]|uniref:Multidrug resistance protein n=1 Tax=Marasmius tenuissimus TaxID=585030 RepID=A0ABR2ZVC1_9AGAR
MTYEEGMKTDFDIILIPGGRPYTGPSPKEGPPDIREFLKKKGPETKYALSVCTGSWQLAYIGLLEGKRATTNKASYNSVVVGYSLWVVNDDKHIWISSGVAAGIDLAYAFLVHLFGEKLADEAKGLIEFSTSKDADHDEFATFYGLA